MAAPTSMPDGQAISTWHIRKGSTFEKAYKWTSGPDELTQTPVDLTGWTGRAQCRDKVDSTVVLFAVDNQLLGGLTLSAQGDITIEVADTVTSAVVPMKGVFDLELVSPAGKVKNFAGGPVIFYPEVTRT